MVKVLLFTAAHDIKNTDLQGKPFSQSLSHKPFSQVFFAQVIQNANVGVPHRAAELHP